MSATFQFDLVTLEKSVLSQDEVMITVPGAEGYFGVLPGHAPFVALLAAGVLTVGEGKEASRYAVLGGYAEVLPDRTTILADRVLCWDAIEPDAVEIEKQEVIARLEKLAVDDTTEAYWKKRLDFADVCLTLHDQYLSRGIS